MARFDFVHRLSQLEAREKHEVVGRTCKVLNFFLEVFRRCSDLEGNAEEDLHLLETALKGSEKVCGECYCLLIQVFGVRFLCVVGVCGAQRGRRPTPLSRAQERYGWYG